ncbi:tetratricopeptide repeat protein 19 homolog, mitochondrial isoform X2 [Drosophila busckii]|uniref:tetratricopeptide repeat protein 19 homolog, mitochondrial isoform X2 n=1 Tax=Drosophila busckii TaxID=30019 RepID=UPI001432EDC2|nr:tetratricopeptide repeat protein 19 homolog, mitochondrial isoform X2 [Drosophila busckii]
MIIKNVGRITQILSRLCALRNLNTNPIDIQAIVHQRSAKALAAAQIRSLCVISTNYQQRQRSSSSSDHPHTGLVLTAAISFSLFDSKDKDEEETPEAKLINTIKRSILCIQREQYEKAEQMLHLCLRMAQDIQSTHGITYVYDLMANLAMERQQFKKAEKIFVDVMRRLMNEGYADDSPKILHISSKIAHMSQMQGELEKSLQGFTWTMQKLAKLVEKMPEDKDILELYGLTKNWY